jgi:hypothetical protein
MHFVMFPAGEHTMNGRCILVVLVLAILPIASSAAEWRNFSDPDGIFSFEVPEQVRVTRQAGTRPDGTALQTTLYGYGADRPGQLGCALAVTDYGEGITLPENTPETIATIFKSQLQALNVQPDIDTGITLDNHSGRHLEFKDLKGNGIAFRWFVVRNRLFHLTCTTPSNASTAETAEVARVASSLRFLAR